jgi:hypothetical protein
MNKEQIDILYEAECFATEQSNRNPSPPLPSSPGKEEMDKAWEVVEFRSDVLEYGIIDSDGRTIVGVCGIGEKERAEFVVTACNSHASLLEQNSLLKEQVRVMREALEKTAKLYHCDLCDCAASLTEAAMITPSSEPCELAVAIVAAQSILSEGNGAAGGGKVNE